MTIRPHLALALSLAAASTAQAPSVVATTPARHAAMGPFDPVVVTFAAPIDPSTVTSQSVSVFGRWTGVVPGTLAVDATAQVVTFQPTRPLFVGDWVTVSMSETITSAGGVPMAGGHHVQFVVRTAPSSGVFQLSQTIPFRMPGETFLGTYGIHAGDVDRDGSPDIIAINEASHDLRIFRNGGCADFGPMTVVGDGGNWPSPHESADFDRDGWLDLVTGDYTVGNVSVFMNDGTGTLLPPIGLQGSTYIRSVGAGDFDADGFPDIVVANGWQTRVWINDRMGGFLPWVGYAFPASAEINVGDFDEDGHLDVVGCSLWPGEVWLMLGNGDGTFTTTSAAPLMTLNAVPFQSAIADLDGDGHLDIAWCCNSPNSFVWALGDGTGNFTPGGTMPAGHLPTSVHAADLEGDGDADVVVTHYGSADSYVYFNSGNATFAAPVILPAVAGAACTTLVDYDRDGDLDIMVADEIVDVGMLYSQVGPTTPGLQQASCDATLRIDQRADGAGYNGTAPVPVHSGAAMALSLSGPAGALGALVLGHPTATSFTLPPWGLVSIDPLEPFVITAAALLDVHGEFVFAQSFPPSAPLGSTLAVQGLVLDPTIESFTNPMQFTIVP